jgi:hypothetical protein
MPRNSETARARLSQSFAGTRIAVAIEWAIKPASSILLAWLAMAAPVFGAGKQPFHLSGVYTDTCSCRVPCLCDLTGDTPDSCQGVGAIYIAHGDFSGSDLSGVKFAYAMLMGNWVRLYIDAPDPARRATAERFLRALCSDWGKLESVRDAKIEISGKDGGYAVKVDDGKTMDYVIAPVIGGDGRSPLVHANTHSPITSTFLQGRSAEPTVYNDGARSFEIAAGRNGYFNGRVDTSGSL